jgi:hypothetical protein
MHMHLIYGINPVRIGQFTISTLTAPFAPDILPHIQIGPYAKSHLPLGRIAVVICGVPTRAHVRYLANLRQLDKCGTLYQSGRRPAWPTWGIRVRGREETVFTVYSSSFAPRRRQDGGNKHYSHQILMA